MEMFIYITAAWAARSSARPRHTSVWFTPSQLVPNRLLFFQTGCRMLSFNFQRLQSSCLSRALNRWATTHLRLVCSPPTRGKSPPLFSNRHFQMGIFENTE